ncbi:MAG: hypothetical protein EBZ47_09240 [Chlamydiae bacterium]|nr:hypothetical protein [Chlamydiota bacterium]
MEKISLDILKKEMDDFLIKQVMSGRSLLDRFSLIDEGSRKSPPYVDPRYAPFYYYLGKCLSPKNMVEIGFDLGLLSASFLTSCRTVDSFFGFKEDNKLSFFSNRLGIKNIKKVYKGNRDFFYGQVFDNNLEKKIRSEKWDLVLINEEKEYDKQLQYMEMMWPNISENGIMVVEYIKSHRPSKEAFKSFVEGKELKSITFDTRYGTGIAQNGI